MANGTLPQNRAYSIKLPHTYTYVLTAIATTASPAQTIADAIAMTIKRLSMHSTL